MPCRDGGPDDGPSAKWILHSSQTAELLCKLCEWVNVNRMMETGVQQALPEVWAWWLDHKEIDAEKQRQQEERRRREELQASALSKLSADELDALGSFGLRDPRKKSRGV